MDPFLLSTLLGLGTSLIGSIFGGRKQPSIEKTPSLDQNQSAIANALRDLIVGGVGRQLPMYGGQLSPEIPAALNQSMATVADLLGMSTDRMLGPWGGTIQNAMGQVLSGAPAYSVDFGQTQQAIEQAQTPVVRQFQQELLPQLRESFVGGGNFWSSSRQQAEAKAASDLAAQLASQRAQGALSDIDAQRQAALAGRQIQAGALPSALSFALQPYQMREEAAQTLGNMAGQLWGMESDSLTKQYNEWLRTQPQNSPYLQMAMQFLGIPMMAMYQPPITGNPWAQSAGIFADLLQGLIESGRLPWTWT